MEYKISTKTLLRGSASILLAFCATNVAAQSASPFEFKLGVGVQREADYEGSDDSETTGVPAIEISWNDRIRFSTLEGIELSADVFTTDQFKTKLGFGYDEGRSESDNTALRGLGDIEGGATFLIGFEYDVDLPYDDRSLSFGLDVERDLKGTLKGTQVEASVQYTQRSFGGDGFWQIGANTVWGDSDHISKHFGITAAQAANSQAGVTQFSGSSGIKSVGLQVGAGYDLTENTLLVGGIEFARLRGDAADSPLVRDFGSRNQTSAHLGVIYSW